MTTHYDAVIMGGGPAGASVALLLARAGWSVVVCERQAMPRRKVCGEYLSATNLPLFDILGIGEVFREMAGPPVRRVGLFAGTTCLEADLPAPAEVNGDFGRALSREKLDPLLIERARQEGAEIRQPCSVVDYQPELGGFRFVLKDMTSGTTEEVTSRLAIAAHGSWKPGTLPSQPPRRPPAPHDLIGFKAHFANSRLPEGLMPLLAFPGGYGGMVHEEEGRISISCCVRRDRLAEIRSRFPGDVGDTVEASLRESCRGVREALEGANRIGTWLSAGPIRPGTRLRHPEGVFAVGNAAGEAHPVVAEGISMALQSSWLLSNRLIAWQQDGASPADLPALAARYARDWRFHFLGRLWTSQAIAAWAMRPNVVSTSLPLLKLWPGLLGLGARWSGKASLVVTEPTIGAVG